MRQALREIAFDLLLRTAILLAIPLVFCYFGYQAVRVFLRFDWFKA